MKGLAYRFRKKLYSHLFIDTNSDYRRTVLLAGTGRSGTTWVSRILNYRNDHRYIFEPFHPQKVSICSGFRYRQYVRPGNDDETYLAPARAILTGRLRSEWSDSHNRKFCATRRLVKDIRANLLLKWIKASFPGVPIILLLRHPCAVANSRLKLNWGTHLDEFLAQEELMEDYLEPLRSGLEGVESQFEGHMWLWCIENYVPLKQFRRGEIHLAFYERFCERPAEEIDRLFHFLTKDVDPSVFESLSQPSVVSRKESPVYMGGSLVNSWKEEISAHQMHRALEILGLFGLDQIYDEDSMPRMDAAYAMMDAGSVIDATMALRRHL